MYYESIIKPIFDLQRFAEGEGGESEGTGAEVAEVAAPDEQIPKSRARRNPLADVKFGVQPDVETADTAQVAAANTTDEPPAEDFESLIKGKYKADFDARVQGIVQARLRNSKQAEEANAKLQPMVQLLAERYGTQDPDALVKALTEDRALYEQEAIEKGIPVELHMQTKQLELKQAMLDAQQREMREKAEAQTMYANLLQQATALKSEMPQFDLDAEMQNPRFGRLVLNPPYGSGIPLADAYYAIHRQEIAQAQRQQQMQVTQQAVQETQRKIANSVAAGAQRPVEYGQTASAPAEVRTDPRTLTPAEREEIRRRVRNGERIAW